MREDYGRLKTYLLAVLACAIALPIARELNAPSSCFLLAAMISSLYGGRGPGYVTILISSILFDFFARRSAEESLRQTQAKLAQATQTATMSQFSASVIHEISQPLSAVVANGLDLASLKSVRACADGLLTKAEPFDVVIA